MTKLQQRLRLYRRRKARRKNMIIMLKKGCMKTAAVLVTVAMVFSIVKIPVVYAYFTAAKESEPLYFRIVVLENVEADVSFIDSFLIDEDKESAAGGKTKTMAFAMGAMHSPSTGRLGESPLNTASLGALLGEEQASIEDKLSRESIVQAEIRLEDGFDPGDIDVSSVELHYGGNSASALSGELNADGALVVDFDRELIASWFAGTGEEMESVTFTVTGEGYAGGLDRFIFSGEASLKLKGSYETRAVAITGVDAFFIPEPGETVEGAYLLVNQDGVELQGARWALDSAGTLEGVEIDLETGYLTVYSNAVQGAVNIIAAIEVEGRLLTAQKTVELYARPELAITGADSITIPLPEEIAAEQYAVEPLEGLALANLTFALLEETDGISIDESGLVTVAATAAGESFTLVARVAVEGVSNPLILKKEVLLETIQIGSVEVTGTENIIIPETEACQESYEALVYDPEGNLLAGEPILWTLEDVPAGSGVSLSEEGVLTVEPHAAAGTITVKAASVRNPAVSGSRSVTLEAPSQEPPRASTPEESSENRLFIQGPTLILIPSGEAAKTYTYTAADCRGNPLEGALFALLEEYPGVTLSGNGELTVGSGAAEGEIVLQALLEENTQTTGEEAQPLAGELKVTLALPAPTAVQIAGPSFIEIPAPGAEGTLQETVETYAALVLDQEGNPLEGAEVAWSLVEAVEGVLLSETGELTVTSGASAGTVTIIAASVSNGEVSGSFAVELAVNEEDGQDESGTEEENEEENGDAETPPGKEEDPPDLEDPPDDDGDDDGTGDDGAAEGDAEDTPGGDDTPDGDEDLPDGEESGDGDPAGDAGDELNTGDESNEQPAYIEDEDDEDGGNDNSGGNAGAEDDGGAPDGGADDSEDAGLKED
jgi:hypothetical protein